MTSSARNSTDCGIVTPLSRRLQIHDQLHLAEQVKLAHLLLYGAQRPLVLRAVRLRGGRAVPIDRHGLSRTTRANVANFAFLEFMMRNKFSIPAAIVLLLAAASVQADLNCAGGMDATGNECMQPSTAAAQPASTTKHSSLQHFETQVRATKESSHSKLPLIRKSGTSPVQVATFETSGGCAGHSGATGNYCE